MEQTAGIVRIKPLASIGLTPTAIQTKAMWDKRTCPRFETASVGFKTQDLCIERPAARSYQLGHRAPLNKMEQDLTCCKCDIPCISHQTDTSRIPH